MEINAHNLSLTATLSTSNLTEDDLTFVWGNKNSIRANTSGSHLNSDAKYAYSKGDSCYAWGDYSYAEGYGPSTPTSDSGYTYVEPTSDIESFKSLYSTAWRPQIAVGEYSRVYGENNLAFGDHSIAMGNDNQVYGNNTIALGNGITANEYLTNSVIITSNLANYRLNLNPTEEVKNCLFVGGSQTVFSPTNSDSVYVNGGLYLMQDVNFELTAEHLYNTRMNIGLTQPYIEMVPGSSSTNSAYISMSKSGITNTGGFSLMVDTRDDVGQLSFDTQLDYVEFKGDDYVTISDFFPYRDTSDDDNKTQTEIINTLPIIEIQMALVNSTAESSSNYIYVDVSQIYTQLCGSTNYGDYRVDVAKLMYLGTIYTLNISEAINNQVLYDIACNSVVNSEAFSRLEPGNVAQWYIAPHILRVGGYVIGTNTGDDQPWTFASNSDDPVTFGSSELRGLNSTKMKIQSIFLKNGYNPTTKENDVSMTLVPYRDSFGRVGFKDTTSGTFYASANNKLVGWLNDATLNSVSTTQIACINFGANNVVNADYSYALGRNLSVNGTESIAIGNSCSTWSAQSMAVGINSIAYGNYSIALGGGGHNVTDDIYSGITESEIDALWSVYWGIELTDSNSNSYYDSFHMAYGKGSAVIGKNDLAKGDYSLAVGEGNVTSVAGQFVCGQYNYENDERLFMIGYGTSNSNRVNVVSFSSEGNGWMTGTLSQGSDARLKDNIEDLGVKGSLRLVEFDWKSTGKHGYGFIADEVEQIYPSMVNEDNDDGYKYLDYNAAICAKLAELEQEIDELKSKLES